MAGAAEARSFSLKSNVNHILEMGKKDSNKFEWITTPQEYYVLTGQDDFNEQRFYLNDPTRRILFVLIPYGFRFEIEDVIYYKLDEARGELEAETTEPGEAQGESEAEIDWGDWPQEFEVSKEDFRLINNERDFFELQERYRQDLIDEIIGEGKKEKMTKKQVERIEEIVEERRKKAKALYEEELRKQRIKEEMEERRKRAEDLRESKRKRGLTVDSAQIFDGFHIV